MSRFILIIISILFILAVGSTAQIQTSISSDEKKEAERIKQAKIKSVTVYRSSYKDGKFTGEEKKGSFTQYTRDGDVEKLIEFDLSGEEMKDLIDEYFVNDSLKEKIIYHYDRSDIERKYDERGKIIERKFKSGLRTTYKYDGNDNNIEKTRYGKNIVNCKMHVRRSAA